jgi:hypothetical protein
MPDTADKVVEDKFGDLSEKISKLFEEYGVDAAAVVVSMEPVNVTKAEYLENPQYRIDIPTLTSFWQRDTDSDTLNDLLVRLTEDDPKFESEEAALLTYYFVVYKCLMSKMHSHVAPAIELIHSRLNLLEKSTGLGKAKVVPMKPNTLYNVFTSSGSIYELEYDDRFKYTLKRIKTVATSDESLPDSPLAFVGNVQDDGTIFAVPSFPVASTGDRMLFVTYPFVDSEDVMAQNPFLTSNVLDVIAKDEVN